MKRMLLFGLVLAVSPTVATAQAADPVIERALLAAPAQLRADATVLQLRPDGTIATLREGTNDLICWDNAGRPGYASAVDTQCTVASNRARLEQNHAFQSAGGSPEEIQARFDQAEANGTRALSTFGSIYYRVRGNSLETAANHSTVAVPHATGESLGLPVRGGAGMLWLMEAGTSSAHLMISGM